MLLSVYLAVMPVIDAKELLEGRRLRRCSPQARLFYPYFVALSNGFGRIELYYELISEKLSGFKEAAPLPTAIEAYFEEYRSQKLIFVYDSNNSSWGQWDTRRANLKRFKTADDKRSPHPPEPAFTDWLKGLHGEAGWRSHHWDQAVGGDQDGHSGIASSRNVAQNSRKLSSSPAQLLRLGGGVGDGGGVGEGDGGGVGVADGNGGAERAAETRQSGLEDSGPVSVSGDEPSFALDQTSTVYKETSNLAALFADGKFAAGEKTGPEDFDTAPIRKLIDEGESPREVQEAIDFVFKKSNYWNKTDKGYLRGTRGFANAYKTIKRQMEKYSASTSIDDGNL